MKGAENQNAGALLERISLPEVKNRTILSKAAE